MYSCNASCVCVCVCVYMYIYIYIKCCVLKQVNPRENCVVKTDMTKNYSLTFYLKLVNISAQ